MRYNPEQKNIKKKGQVFSSNTIVSEILDNIEYDGTIKLDILDPSCGDGQFLLEILKRIIKNNPKENVVSFLVGIHGWDIDNKAVESCINRLDAYLKENNIEWSGQWNIKCINALTANKEYKFDIIVGNPPYIRIKHLDTDTRAILRESYSFCKKGATDIYYAFFQIAVTLLKPNGICGFITPSSWLTTETGKTLRYYFKTKQNIVKIINHGGIQQFDKASTRTATTIFTNSKNESFHYIEFNTYRDELVDKIVAYNDLQDCAWRLSGEQSIQSTLVLKDICTISVGLATLCDKVFVIEYLEEKEDTYKVNTKLSGIIEIEKGVVKKIIKGSKPEKKLLIFFPYIKDHRNKYIPMNEDYLKTNFPMGYEYIKSHKEILDKRSSGAPVWFAFGRTQAIDTGFSQKIFFSPITKDLKFNLSYDTEATFYSGYAIQSKYDLQRLLELLNSKTMETYIKTNSADMGDGWLTCSKKLLEQFPVPTDF